MRLTGFEGTKGMSYTLKLPLAAPPVCHKVGLRSRRSRTQIVTGLGL